MPESAKKTTIYDLAELAGTSAGTVSAVINGNWKKRRISEKLAQRVLDLAEKHGFALNMQARALSREKSGIIGMIVPMYDNRYFSSIAQSFEARAREAGYFPIVTCTRRDPELEVAAARAMLGYQVELLVCTGATDPDRIHDLCAAAGVPTLNLDLPGGKATSIISDNFAGAFELTNRLISSCGNPNPSALFVGGRASDHNTRERINGFRESCRLHGIDVPKDNVLSCGYAAEKANVAYRSWITTNEAHPALLFVNSTISLEGLLPLIDTTANKEEKTPVVGCFDWDPFAARTRPNMIMVRQDVASMIKTLFEEIEDPSDDLRLIQIPTIIPPQTKEDLL